MVWATWEAGIRESIRQEMKERREPKREGEGEV